MLKRYLKFPLIVAVLISVLFTYSCEKDEEPEPEPAPTTGIVSGFVTDGNSSDALADIRIVLFNANTNEPTGFVTTTGSDGAYAFTIAGGSYYIKLSGQGYVDVPARGNSAIPFSIANGATTSNNVEMYINGLTDIGWIYGQLTTTDASVSGCLIVADDGIEGYSTISDETGYYIIYNIPIGNYSIQGWKSSVTSSFATATVVADTSVEVGLNLIAATGVVVSGSITFLATSNIDVDVELTHPITKESIPGLNAITSSGSYSISGVTDETYLARASYVNDGVVMDPDWIVKNGEPFVTVSGSNTIRDFSVTGAAILISPTNDAASTLPVSSTAIPTFSWDNYSSSSDYVIEVQNANGHVIWGGFSSNWTIKNITIPSSQTSIVYNSDGNATESLQSGKVYRWKIYASKNNSQSPTGWELISSSEDQMGLIIIE